jgi:hypothetical protein
MFSRGLRFYLSRNIAQITSINKPLQSLDNLKQKVDSIKVYQLKKRVFKTNKKTAFEGQNCVLR